MLAQQTMTTRQQRGFSPGRPDYLAPFICQRVATSRIQGSERFLCKGKRPRRSLCSILVMTTAPGEYQDRRGYACGYQTIQCIEILWFETLNPGIALENHSQLFATGGALNQKFRHRDGGLKHQWCVNHVPEVENPTASILSLINQDIAGVKVAVDGLPAKRR